MIAWHQYMASRGGAAGDTQDLHISHSCGPAPVALVLGRGLCLGVRLGDSIYCFRELLVELGCRVAAKAKQVIFKWICHHISSTARRAIQTASHTMACGNFGFCIPPSTSHLCIFCVSLVKARNFQILSADTAQR